MAKRKGHELEPAGNRRSLSKASSSISKPTTQQAHPAFGLIFVGAGIFPFLIGLGVIPIGSAHVHCPLFILTAIGFAFMSAGSLICVQGLGFSPKSKLVSMLGFCTITGLFAPFVWVAFGDSGVEPFARIFVGFIVGIFGLLFAAGALASMFPSLAQKLGIRIECDSSQAQQITNKQRKL